MTGRNQIYDKHNAEHNFTDRALIDSNFVTNKIYDVSDCNKHDLNLFYSDQLCDVSWMGLVCKQGWNGANDVEDKWPFYCVVFEDFQKACLPLIVSFECGKALDNDVDCEDDVYNCLVSHICVRSNFLGVVDNLTFDRIIVMSDEKCNIIGIGDVSIQQTYVDQIIPKT